MAIPRLVRPPRGVLLPAIGPCIIAAPFILVLAIAAAVLWPFVLAGIAILWIAIWPLEALLVAFGAVPDRRVSAWIGRAALRVLRAWTTFERHDEAVTAPPARDGAPQTPTGVSARDGRPPAG